MKWVVGVAALFVLVVYLLLDSGALEFRTKTIEQNELIERVAFKPVFHRDRLENDLRRHLASAREFAAGMAEKVRK